MKVIFSIIFSFLIALGCFADKYQLQLNLKVGNQYRQYQRSNIYIKQNISGVEVKIKMTIKGEMVYEVLNFKQNNYNINVWYSSIQMDMYTPQGIIQFDSENHSPNNIFSSILERMSNTPFQIRITKEGKIKSITGISDLYNSAFDEFPHISSSEREQIMKQLSEAFGEETFKENFEMIFGIYPANKVSINDSWKKMSKQKSFNSNTITTYKLVQVIDSSYFIEGYGYTNVEMEDSYSKLANNSLTYNVSGNVESKIRLNKKSGWIENVIIIQNFSGNAKIKNYQGEMSIPMEFEANNKFSNKPINDVKINPGFFEGIVHYNMDINEEKPDRNIKKIKETITELDSKPANKYIMIEEYDSLMNLTSITKLENSIQSLKTTYTYNSNSQKIRMCQEYLNPDNEIISRKETYFYDSEGNFSVYYFDHNNYLQKKSKYTFDNKRLMKVEIYNPDNMLIHYETASYNTISNRLTISQYNGRNELLNKRDSPIHYGAKYKQKPDQKYNDHGDLVYFEYDWSSDRYGFAVEYKYDDQENWVEAKRFKCFKTTNGNFEDKRELVMIRKREIEYRN